jgi:hypothetical protein
MEEASKGDLQRAELSLIPKYAQDPHFYLLSR